MIVKKGTISLILVSTELIRTWVTVNPLILACMPLAAGSLTLAGLAVGGGK